MRTVKLSSVLKLRTHKIKIDDATNYKLVRIRLHRKGVTLRHEKKGAEIRTKTQQLCREGDFIVAEMDAKVGGYGFIPKSLEGAIVSSHYYLYEIDKKQLSPSFLNVICQAGILQDQIVAKGSTNYASVRAHTVLDWSIPLPSLAEQKHIACQFEEVEAANKELSAEITHQRTLLGKLKQAILQEAIQGKLTADWRAENPDVEPASELLKRIQTEKARLIAEKKIRKEKPLPKITPEEIPFEIPETWEWCRLGEVVWLMNGATFASSHFQKENGIKCVKITNAGVQKFIETDDTLPSEFIEKYSNYRVFNGDIILALTRPYIADGLKISRCPKSYDGALLNQRVAAIRSVNQNFASGFVYLFLCSNFVLQGYQTEFDLKGQQPNLKTSHITHLRYPLPPLAEQTVIVERVEALMATCRELEAEIERSSAYAAELLQAILKEAFAPAS